MLQTYHGIRLHQRLISHHFRHIFHLPPPVKVPYVLQEEAIAEVPQQQVVELRREELQPMAEEVLKQVP